MAATVDVQSLTVCDGDRRYGFTADCAAGTATLHADKAVHIRLLRWGEKCALARYASAGPDFLAGQMLSLCADGPGAPMRDPALALVLWLHAPEAPPLPMDARLLARVTLDLCRALGSQPPEIAALPAPEVEQLWRARDGARPAAEAALPDDVTQIIVLPDEVQNGPRATAAAPADPSEALTSAAAGLPSPAEPTMPESPSGAATTPMHPEHSAPAEEKQAVEMRPRFRVRLTPEAAPMHARKAPAFESEEKENVAGGPAWPMVRSLGPMGLPPGAGGAEASPFVGASSARRPSAPASMRATLRREASMAPLGVPDRAAESRDDVAAAELPTAALGRVIAAVSRQQAASPAAMAPEEADQEADLDDLAERLEEAVAALGIAVVD